MDDDDDDDDDDVALYSAQYPGMYKWCSRRSNAARERPTKRNQGKLGGGKSNLKLK